MAKRPTIPDLAQAAGVSISTVNRVINNAESVRQSTRELVFRVAQEIGFYGLGTIQHAIHVHRESFRFGVLLLQKHRQFYASLSQALKVAAEKRLDKRIELFIEHLDDLSPQIVCERLEAMAQDCDAIALVSAEHPLISNKIDSILERDIPVFGLITPLAAKGNVGFVGLDNFKVGRTAAWAFDQMCKAPGKIGILLGNNRYRNQDQNESGFRSYFRENNQSFQLLEPLATYESSAIAREKTEELLSEHPDLQGLFISGGGITGAIAALRDCPRSRDLVIVGYELFDTTRTALIEGNLSLVISHPLDRLAEQTIANLIQSKATGLQNATISTQLGFDIYTPENL